MGMTTPKAALAFSKKNWKLWAKNWQTKYATMNGKQRRNFIAQARKVAGDEVADFMLKEYGRVVGRKERIESNRRTPENFAKKFGDKQ